MRILRNRCFDLQRKQSKRVVVDIDLDSVAAETKPADDSRWADVYRALERLPKTDRAVIVLRWMCDIDNAGAANMLHMRKNTFDVRLHRAMRKLKTMVDRESAD